MRQQEDPGLTREELRRVVRKAGFLVSAAQLKRWHKAGLLLRPQRRSMGRGKGMESRYPSFVALQAITVAMLRKRLRDLELIGWYLWCCGFGPTRRARAYLLRVAAKEHREAIKDLEEFEREVPQNRIEASATRRLPPMLGQMRRRVGRQFMPTLQRLWSEMALGRQDVLASLEKEDIERLLGLGQLITDPGESGSSQLDQRTYEEVKRLLPIVLSGFTSALRTDTVGPALERAEDQVLERIRDELQTLLTYAGYGRLGDNDVLAPPAVFLTYFKARATSEPFASVVQKVLSEALKEGRIPAPRPAPLVRTMLAVHVRRKQ